MTPSVRAAAELLEPVSPWAGWLRKGLALATVARRRRGVLSQDAYGARVEALSRQAAETSSLWHGIWTLWRIESLTFACADRWRGELSLSARRLPLEAGPPAACGLSMAAVLEAGFDAPSLTRVLEARADPRFIDFCFESLGLMLAAYEPDLFGRVTATFGRLGLMRRYRLTAPEPATFLTALPERWRPYAAHGFGRLLYFKSHGLRGAARGLLRRPWLPFTPALKGAVAAHVLVNGSRLPKILRLADEELTAELESGVRGGLRNVLTLLAWSLPGRLDRIEAPGDRSASLLAAARRAAATARQAQVGPGLAA